MIFKKLDIELNPGDLANIKGTISRDYRIDGTGFHEFAIVDLNYMRSIFDRKVKFTIEPDIIHIADASIEVYPHTDLCNVSLNYYIETGNESTIFYRTSDAEGENFSRIGWYKARHKENDHVWMDDKLVEVDSFVGQKNEVWLLDTSIIHGVKLNEGAPNRSMIRCVWHGRSFDEILNSIVIL